MGSRVGINNPFYGKKHTTQTLEKMRLTKLGEKNPMWRGDNVSYGALHDWVKDYLSKPELCQRCKKVPPYDLSNKSGKYLRDLDDWYWLCRSCHMIIDYKNNIRTKTRVKKHSVSKV